MHAYPLAKDYYMVDGSGKNRLASSPLTVSRTFGWLAKDLSPNPNPKPSLTMDDLLNLGKGEEASEKDSRVSFSSHGVSTR